MGDSNDVYAVAYLKTWFQEHQGLFSNRRMNPEFKDSGHGSAYVRLDSTRYMAEICVWDHASCLDVQILEKSTEESTFPHVGECKTKVDFEYELSKFLDWLKDGERNSI